jgi:CelD/BcsL family acetyltransferase involved in cellulose biosynthesis
MPRSTVFQTPAWIQPWWKVFEPGNLRSIAVWHGDRLVGLAPIYLESGSFGARLLPLGIGLSDYCDVLLAPDYTTEAAAVLVSAFERLGDWETCEFPELLPEACALALPVPPAFETQVMDASIAPVLQIPAAGDLFDIIPASQSRRIRRARSVLSRSGDARIIESCGSAAPQALGDLVRLHTAHWSNRGQDGVFADPRVQQFHARALPALAAQGLVRLYSVIIRDKVVAVYYGFQHGNRAYAYLEGYDPQFSKFSPGNLVIAHAIDCAIREGAAEFHFLRGEEPYKFEWGAWRRVNQTRVFKRQSAAS